MHLSIVIPVLNEELSLQPLHEELVKVLKDVTDEYELIFVDDGSTDQSSQVIELLHRNNHRVKLIQFRKNFGKSAALLAGFKKAMGDIVITMDADLQDDPKEIPRFLDALQKGYDLVSGWKHKRQDSLARRVPSRIFNRIVPFLTGVKLHDLNCGFKAYRAEVVKDLRIYGELHRYIPVLAAWKGFRMSEITVEHHRRPFGKSRYGIERFIRGVLDFITVYFLTRYLKRPLHLLGGIGISCLFVGFTVNVYFGVQWLLGLPLHLRPVMIFGWVMIILGVQFIMMGLIGEMIAHHNGNSQDIYEIKKQIN
jgi:glycosyltransferase involved in cell wall biosynthesis